MRILRNFLSLLSYVVFFAMVVYAIYYLIDMRIHPLSEVYNGTGPLKGFTRLVVVLCIGVAAIIALRILVAVVQNKMKEKGISNLSKKEIEDGILWKARKRNVLGLPWTFTVYLLDMDRLFIRTGLLNSREDEVRLYRIVDMTLKRSLWQKILGVGTIHCDSSDQTLKNFNIINIKASRSVKTMLSKLVDESRIKNKVYTSESVSNSFPHQMEGNVPPLPMPEIDRTDVDGNGVPDVFEQ